MAANAATDLCFLPCGDSGYGNLVRVRFGRGTDSLTQRPLFITPFRLNMLNGDHGAGIVQTERFSQA